MCLYKLASVDQELSKSSFLVSQYHIHLDVDLLL